MDTDMYLEPTVALYRGTIQDVSLMRLLQLSYPARPKVTVTSADSAYGFDYSNIPRCEVAIDVRLIFET
uniref:Uncharacterized protein n=1 Tax=Megaselia scalaris TaxID=36166 RepID=T1GY44_MEGSC